MMISTTRGRAARAVLAAASVLVLAGCSGSADEERAEGDGPGLVVYNGASGQFVENYNPLSPTVLGSIPGMVFEPLFYFNNLAPLDEPPVPLLGESYEFNEDGTVVTVTTKSGVTWSDGEPFTAEDAAFTFNLVRDTPELNTSGNAPSAEATSDTSLTLTYEQAAFVDVPNTLGLTHIVPEHLWADKTDVATDINEDPVGTGPMAVADFTNQSYLLERNERFRDVDDVAVPSVRVLSLSGNQAATDQLLAGQLDWAGVFIPDVDTVLRAAPDVSYSASASQQIMLATCSNAALGCTGPQTSPVVRQAISLAMDRDQINQLAYFGKGSEISPTYALLERDADLIAPEFSEPAPMTAQPDEARALLEGDGWVEGPDGVYAKAGERLSMTALVTSGYTDYIATLEAITQQVAGAGIELRVQQVANNEILSTMGLGNFQVAISGLFQGPVGDPYYIYNNSFGSTQTSPVGESGNPYANISRFSSPEVDAALAEAAATDDLAAKAAAYAKVHAVIVPDLPYIPVLNNVGFASFNTGVYSGWPTYEDQYAPATPGTTPGNGVVLTRLQPTS